MKIPDRETQRMLVKQWKRTGQELDRIRREKLKGMPYNWQDVDALLELGATAPPNEQNGHGLVEMQRRFMALMDNMGRGK